MNWISKARNFFNMQTGETAAENSAQNQPLNQDDVGMLLLSIYTSHYCVLMCEFLLFRYEA